MASARDLTVIRQVPGKTTSSIFFLLHLNSLTHSNIFVFFRRTYRYNDRASPAEVASETSKPQNLSMNIRSKTVSSPVSKQPTAATQKKINLGAAANFGKTPNAAGIHSPTHRDTPSTTNNTVDLMGGASPTNNNNSKNKSNNTSSNNNDLLDDIFKTCAPTPEKTLNSAAVIVDDDDDFNPRAGDSAPATQEFGDFAAAFGVGHAGGPSPPSTGILPAATTADNDEFADFAAFESSSSTALADQLVAMPTPASDSFDLFNSPATPAATAAPTATDLLAGLGDLSIHQSMPMGKHVTVDRYI